MGRPGVDFIRSQKGVELKCRSPTLSDDSGKHSAPSVHSETLSHGIALSYGAGTRDIAVTVVELRKNKGEPLGIVLATEDLEEDDYSSSLHSIVPPFCNEIAETMENFEFNTLTFLYKPENELLQLDQLHTLASDLIISISPADGIEIEQKTRGQSSNNLWFDLQAGRITASKFKAVCKTDLNKPSLSLLRSICYPKNYSFPTRATKYGCSHEKDAIQSYRERVLGNFRKSKKFYLKKNEDGSVELRKDRQYFFQIQLKLALTERMYYDFVVWSKQDVYYERIEADVQFWSSNKPYAEKYFHKIILPELLGKIFTKRDEILDIVGAESKPCISKLLSFQERLKTPFFFCEV
ncbi:hypothetical protein CBL_20340 [Carabus blaptoides fortunei]